MLFDVTLQWLLGNLTGSPLIPHVRNFQVFCPSALKASIYKNHEKIWFADLFFISTETAYADNPIHLMFLKWGRVSQRKWCCLHFERNSFFSSQPPSVCRNVGLHHQELSCSKGEENKTWAWAKDCKPSWVWPSSLINHCKRKPWGHWMFEILQTWIWKVWLGVWEWQKQKGCIYIQFKLL